MIKLEGVSKVYPDGTQAVNDLSLEIADGEICVLIGPSGCGKTTTMRMINRLIEPSAGTIYIDDVPTSSLPPEELRRNIGYAIQDIGLFPHLTVGQNIEVVPSLKGWPEEKRRERAYELLRLVGMDPDIYYSKYPRELSGGQAQRVGVARALGADPPILLMDEPFGAIDPITRSKLQDEFQGIQEELKKTIVFVTHDIYEAIKMGDKIALMRKGRLVQHDTPANIIFNPQDKFVEDFLGTDRAIKGLQLIKVYEVMQKNPPLVTTEDTANAALATLEEASANWLVVVAPSGQFMGWFEPREGLDGESKVDEVFAADRHAVGYNTSLSDALSLMLSRGHDRIAVVSRRGRLRGVVTFDDIRSSLSRISSEPAEEGR